MAAHGAEILVSNNPMGRYMEFKIGAAFTPKPGTIVEIDSTVAAVGGRFTVKAWAASKLMIVLLPDSMSGKVATEAYAAADRAFGYVPALGEELNLLVKDVAGTATVAAGDLFGPEATSGKLVTAGVEFLLLEDIVAMTADRLEFFMYVGA